MRRKAKPNEAKKWLEDHLSADEHSEQCIEWPFADNGNGYGVIGVGEKPERVHVIACEKRNGPRPIGMQSAHSCGNRRCCNPDHLRWATPLENTREKRLHGTQTVGSDCYNSKLTESDAAKIYKDKRRYSDIAGDYGITETCIGAIKAGRSWVHVTGGADVREGNDQRGEKSSRAKLTEAQAIAIYNDSRTTVEISKEYGIRNATVSKIKLGQRWASVTGHGSV